MCNNAGVSPLGAAWENTPADWQWILGVNLWGVINGVRAFTPYLIAQNEGHIVNTASVSGLISPPGSGAYNVTRHAVVTLSETLHHELRERSLDLLRLRDVHLERDRAHAFRLDLVRDRRKIRLIHVRERDIHSLGRERERHRAAEAARRARDGGDFSLEVFH